jgi:uncharacterized protein (TIGR02266 family)
MEAISSLTGVRPRIQPRVRVSLPVAIRSGGSAFRGRTKDLSSTGLFVRTRQPLRTGVPVWIEMSVPATHGRSVVTAHGMVVRNVADDPSSYLVAGNAVHLQELEEQDRRTLESFIGLQEIAP